MTNNYTLIVAGGVILISATIVSGIYADKIFNFRNNRVYYLKCIFIALGLIPGLVVLNWLRSDPSGLPEGVENGVSFLFFIALTAIPICLGTCTGVLISKYRQESITRRAVNQRLEKIRRKAFKTSAHTNLY